jgi:hypothetical protein
MGSRQTVETSARLQVSMDGNCLESKRQGTDQSVSERRMA